LDECVALVEWVAFETEVEVDVERFRLPIRSWDANGGSGGKGGWGLGEGDAGGARGLDMIELGVVGGLEIEDGE
jgi:hypothetical protein